MLHRGVWACFENLESFIFKIHILKNKTMCTISTSNFTTHSSHKKYTTKRLSWRKKEKKSWNDLIDKLLGLFCSVSSVTLFTLLLYSSSFYPPVDMKESFSFKIWIKNEEKEKKRKKEKKSFSSSFRTL